MAKRKWGKPKLIVLTRGKPEEMVLVGCKWGLGPGGGVEWVVVGCYLACGPECESMAQS